MSKSSIEWTEQTWNPIVGCSIVSPGCTNCYAMKMASRIEAMGNQPRYAGTTRKVNGNAIWTGKLAQAPESTLLEPLRRKKPTTYFVNSMGDLFHEDCPDQWIDRVFAVMALAPQHTFQVLTKRAKRMRDYCNNARVRAPGFVEHACGLALKIPGVDPSSARYLDIVRQVGVPYPLPNVWLGVSTERQQEADERIPLLLKTPAAVRFISAEPLLGPINLKSFNHRGVVGGHSALHDHGLGKLDWVIVGGESGPNARPMHVGWARDLLTQCQSAGVPFFFKQFGEWHPRRGPEFGGGIAEHCIAYNGAISRGDELKGGGERPRWIAVERIGKKRAGRRLDGIEHNAMPGRG
jgi:protein gp37